MTFAGWTALPAGTPAAAVASYRLWEAQERRAEKLADLAAWAVPAPTLPAGYVDASTSPAGDGTTDDTAALQALLDGFSGGETLFFPAATYRIDGPVTISKAVALVGEAGTLLDCSNATGHVIRINLAGNISSPLVGVSLYGLDIEGPGIFEGVYGAEPLIRTVYGKYLDGFAASFCRIHDAREGLTLDGCAGSTVEDCVFDTIMHTGVGYHVLLSNRTDDTAIRRCFFVGDGRVGVDFGAGYATVEANWPGATLIEDCYFEDLQSYGISSHPRTRGPITARYNVMADSYGGFQTRGSTGGSIVTDNAFIGCLVGGYLGNTLYSDLIDDTDPADPDRTYIEEFGYALGGPAGHADTFSRNVVTVPDQTLYVGWTNATVADNVLVYTDVSPEPAVEMADYVPTGAIEIVGNIYSRTVNGNILLTPTGHATLVSGNTYLPGIPVPVGPAAFTASPAAPYAGQTIQFTDTTPGSPSSWLWDFGDGDTIDGVQNPVHQYAVPGTYPITLTAGAGTTSAVVVVRRTPTFFTVASPVGQLTELTLL
ncbi:MAG TPA: PKD domain-containing protein [Methanoregulaceae archaeon]|nr:PKD domain-containing protein [Methanoregulaceae archaeon]